MNFRKYQTHGDNDSGSYRAAHLLSIGPIREIEPGSFYIRTYERHEQLSEVEHLVNGITTLFAKVGRALDRK